MHDQAPAADRSSRPWVAEATYLVLLAAVVGALGGLGNIVLRLAVAETWLGIQRAWAAVGLAGPRPLTLTLLPLTGALVLIALDRIFPGEVFGYTFPRFLEQVNLRGALIRKRTILAKLTGAAATIGSGASAGVEGPVAFIGGGLGSTIGQWLGAPGPRLRILVACGAAGAIAATFNAPIAGVLFASEIVLLGDFELESFGAIVISSGVATVISRAWFGPHPAFAVPPYELMSARELVAYVVLGVVAGLVGAAFIRIFHATADAFRAWQVPPYAKLAAGFAGVGVLAVAFPEIMGNGYEHVQMGLAGGLSWTSMAALMVAKIAATSVTLGAGGSGGVFAPALYVGTMCGGTVGAALHAAFPTWTASPTAYALVGMGAMLAATVRAPLTSMFLLFELTGNYQVALPVMFASVTALLVARAFVPESIDTFELQRRGIDLESGREISVLNSLLVRDAMTREVTTLNERMPLKEIVSLIPLVHDDHFPVVNEDNYLTGILTFEDIRAILFEEGLGDLVVAKEVATQAVVTVTPTDTLATAMTHFARSGVGSLPVVTPGDSKRVVGVLRRQDVIRAYNSAVLRRQHARAVQARARQ